jgi:Glycosyl hydrolase family 26
VIASLVMVLELSACIGQAQNRRQAQTCVFSGNHTSQLTEFNRLVGTRLTCALIFDTDQPTWSSWEDPYFLTSHIPTVNWVSFARRRQDELIITVELFPDQAETQNWRVLGAEGAYASYARVLARNLVAAGMGHAVIRLAHEANGTWFDDNIGTTPQQWALWRTFWRKTVFAMRSVRGAHFSFNWCISAGYRAIPFADYYPGNDVVDSIGVDIYDSGEPAGEQHRWAYAYNKPGGVGAIARFARSQGKPLTIPEWGLEPVAQGGGGDDPAFVQGIADVLRRDNVAFQSYFFAENTALEFEDAPRSLAVYRRMIGAG